MKGQTHELGKFGGNGSVSKHSMVALDKVEELICRMSDEFSWGVGEGDRILL